MMRSYVSHGEFRTREEMRGSRPNREGGSGGSGGKGGEKRKCGELALTGRVGGRRTGSRVGVRGLVAVESSVGKDMLCTR